MLIRRNFAFVASTYPWVWGSFTTWWVDRLFVELGHRATAAPLCNHSNIQYQAFHCYVTIAAICCQTLYSINIRDTQFRREKILLGITTSTCIIHIYLLQACICTMWAIIIACLADVSPWLCNDVILGKRASIALTAAIAIVILVMTEHTLYTRSLERELSSVTDI